MRDALVLIERVFSLKTKISTYPTKLGLNDFWWHVTLGSLHEGFFKVIHTEVNGRLFQFAPPASIARIPHDHVYWIPCFEEEDGPFLTLNRNPIRDTDRAEQLTVALCSTASDSL